MFVRIPAFTLYGDATVVYQSRLPDPGLPSGQILPPVATAHMDEDQVQALLRFALGAGRLATARTEYLDLGADALSTVFTLGAGEFSKTVTIVGLTEEPQAGPDAADRGGFATLKALLSDFGVQVARGQATNTGPYAPPAYFALLVPAGDAQPGAKPWPWPELRQTDLAPDTGGNGFFVVTLTADQVAKLATLPIGGIIGLDITGPDGKAYQLSVRPALPDQLRVTYPLSISNGTTLDVTLVVNGRAIDTVPPGAQRDPLPAALLPTLPWLVEARSPSGRVLSSMTVRQGDVSRTSDGNGGVLLRGHAVRVDLSCGRLDLWSGPPMAGPMPGPGTPGDCAP